MAISNSLSLTKTILVNDQPQHTATLEVNAETLI